MTVGQFLQTAVKKLEAAGINSARLDCLILLEDTLHKDRANVLAHPEIALSKSQSVQLNNYITQREEHIPLAYIRGKVVFYGRYFTVNTHVLVPRPETEAMIDLLKKLSLPTRPRVADIGSGSGCIGITAALEIPGANVFLYDIDSATCTIAKRNARDHNVRIHIAQQNVLAGCSEQFDVILANLPYVPDGYEINTAATFEPELALFAGSDGLDVYRTFWQQIHALNTKPQYILIESLTQQHQELSKLALEAGYSLTTADNLVQLFTYEVAN
ncbi:MAG: HemK/PrmC family methyltransferase [Patescibacteria group bacterium]